MSEAEMFASMVEPPPPVAAINRAKLDTETWGEYRSALLSTLPAGLRTGELTDAQQQWRALILGTGARDC